ncbi:class I SAM-dependent methyltransferase [Amycolatopsis sp. CA-128772]|uniref:class I SAM-dependent methyltransferase n=1 Tax=Amycolatopsis sp. CA-128772 TaxID=2073159 RepID=UPI0018EE20C3|nr:class I SAM-dependent methyltransferase [Amycolatopsis sp. CA-128772]
MRTTAVSRNTPRAGHAAFTAVAARAAHLLVDREPVIFSGPLAAPLPGDHAEELLAYHRMHTTHPVPAGACAEAVCRSRFADDRPATGNSGIYQYPIPGTGPDSFAYRTMARRFRVFEVGHPATQEVERELPAAAGVAEPPSVTFVPAGFEAEPLEDGSSSVDWICFAPCPRAGSVSPCT